MNTLKYLLLARQHIDFARVCFIDSIRETNTSKASEVAADLVKLEQKVSSMGTDVSALIDRVSSVNFTQQQAAASN